MFNQSDSGRVRMRRALCAGLILSIGLACQFAGAQDDDTSHRRLRGGGRGFGDLRAQAELLTRLRMLTDAANLADGQSFPMIDPDANPGVADPQVQQALQEMLSEQLIESLMSGPPDPNGLPQPGSSGEFQPGGPGSPTEIDVSDPRVREVLNRLPPQTRQPIEEMIRQRSESGPDGPGRNVPGARPGNGSSELTPEQLRELFNGLTGIGTGNNTLPGTPPTSPRSVPPPAENPARQQQVDQITEMLRRIGMNGGVQPGQPGSEPNGRTNPGLNGGTDTRPGSERWSPGDNQNGTETREPATVRERAIQTGQLPEEDAGGPESRTPESAGDIWQSIGRAMREARDGSSGGSDTGARSAFARALEDTATDLATQAEEWMQSSSPQFQQRSSEPGFFERVGRATESANDWAVGLAGGGNNRAPRRSAGGASTGTAGGGSFSLMSLVVISLILTTCIALFRHRDMFNRGMLESGLPEIPRHLRNRRDVVRAFHALAARFPAVLHDWWPHRRAAVALAKANPEQREAIATLAKLYEAARYMPEDAEFTQQQLDSARSALRRFEVS